uniref:CLIP domain-containing serine protease n=1 Tax=Anopheles quadriannulatus TaxID=34691 RepID=A0A182XHQ9_ANOQN
MSLDEICWKLLMFPWLVKLAHWKGICFNHMKTTTPFPFITLPPNYTFPASTASSAIPFTPLTSPSLTFSTGTTPTGAPFTSTTFATTSPSVPFTFSTSVVTQTIPVPSLTSTTFITQAPTTTGSGATFPPSTISNPVLTSTPSTPLFPTVTFTNPPTGTGTLPGAILTSTLSPVTPVTGISPLPTFPTFLSTINPPGLTSTVPTTIAATTVSCPSVPPTCPSSVLSSTTFSGFDPMPSIDPRQTYNDDSCLTPNAQNGICIVYVNCDFILQLLIRNANLRDPAIENYVAQSVCGYSDVTPMVCCPTFRFAHQDSNTTSSFTNPPTVTTAPGSFFFAAVSSSGAGSSTAGPTTRWVVHERYDEKKIYNDIALVLLQKSVTITEAVRPICLPLEAKQRTKDLTYYAPFIAGWGAVGYNGPTAARLQEAQVVVLPVDQCAFNYKLYFPGQIFDDTVLCAGFPQGGKDSCQGDSGGPLMLPELSSNGQYYYYTLIGLISYGYECARAGFPGVYVKVTAYLPWIEANLNF